MSNLYSETVSRDRGGREDESEREKEDVLEKGHMHTEDSTKEKLQTDLSSALGLSELKKNT